MGSDSEEDSDLSFHINSTYCSSSDSDEDRLHPISRHKASNMDSANPASSCLSEHQNDEFVDNPSGIFNEGTDLRSERTNSRRAGTSQGKERPMFTNHRQIAHTEPVASMSAPLSNTGSTARVMPDVSLSEIDHLKSAIASLTQRNATLQVENHQLRQQVHAFTLYSQFT